MNHNNKVCKFTNRTDFVTKFSFTSFTFAKVIFKQQPGRYSDATDFGLIGNYGSRELPFN